MDINNLWTKCRTALLSILDLASYFPVLVVTIKHMRISKNILLNFWRSKFYQNI